MSLILQQIFWPDSVRGDGLSSEYTSRLRGGDWEWVCLYEYGGAQVLWKVLPGNCYWEYCLMMLIPSYILWVCLLRPLISQTQLLPTCSTSFVVCFRAAYQDLRDLALRSFLLAQGHYHCSPSGSHPTFCLLTHFPPSIVFLVFQQKSQIPSCHSCLQTSSGFPLSIWLVQIVLVGLKGHLKLGSKAPS